jgi:hypothetical protein
MESAQVPKVIGSPGWTRTSDILNSPAWDRSTAVYRHLSHCISRFRSHSLLPFYHHLKNELTNPDRIRVQTEYFWRRWEEFWEDSPEGWPQRWGSKGGQFRLDGRPTAQWSRIRAGRDDDLGGADLR